MGVVALDGIADGPAPAVGAEGVGVLGLSEINGLDESLGEIGEGAGGAGSAALAAISEGETTQGLAVLSTERGHKGLLMVEFWDC